MTISKADTIRARLRNLSEFQQSRLAPVLAAQIEYLETASRTLPREHGRAARAELESLCKSLESVLEVCE